MTLAARSLNALAGQGLAAGGPCKRDALLFGAAAISMASPVSAHAAFPQQRVCSGVCPPKRL